MLNTLKSRIFLFLAGILILTSSITAFIVKNETEKALFIANENHARNLADTVYNSIISSYNSIMYHKETLTDVKKVELQNIVGIVHEILNHYYNLAESGQMSTERAKKEASDTIRVIKFGQGTGYIWINDTKKPLPHLIVHPVMPELEGKTLENPVLADAAGTGENLLSILADIALEQGEGFLAYNWPRPENSGISRLFPKLSFVKFFRPWNWVIGSGIYIDDINEETEKKKKATIKDLSEMMSNIKIGETGYMYLFNGDLEVLVHPFLRGMEGWGIVNSATGNKVIKDLYDAVKSGINEYSYPWELDDRNKAGQKTRLKKAYIRHIEPLDWYLASSIYTEELSGPAKILGIKILLISFLFIVLSSFISFYLSRTLSSPLRKLSEAIHAAERKKLFTGASFPVSGTEETMKLGETLNSLVNSIISYKAEADERMEKFSRLAENLNEKYIFFSCSPEGSITFASRSVENITGYNREEFIPIFERIIKNEGILKTDSLWKPDGPVTFETEFTHKKGQTIFFEITEVPYVNTENALLYFDGIIKDTTEKKLNDEKLRQAQKMETIGVLAGGLAHDFNNLLGGIVGPASLIRFVLDEALPEITKGERCKIDNYLRMIEESGNKASEIVRQLMTIARNQKINTSDVDLSIAVNHVFDICKNTFDKSVSISVNCSIENPLILADKTQIEQVILNLCVNSYHAMTSMRPAGDSWGGQLNVDISSLAVDSFFRKTHPEAESLKYMVLSINDTGIGIAKENISKIFTPFFSTKKEAEGTGLGLTMTYNIVKQHKGFIDVYSEPGKGTIFKIFLPAATQTEGEKREAAETAGPQSGKGLVLVIDDEEIMRDVAKEILQHCGYEVITAVNGRDGVEKYRVDSGRIAVVLLDMAMPEMSGRETYLMLREINPHVKVVLASGNRNDKRVTDAISLGVNRFLEKPYTMSRLSGIISEVIGSIR